MIIKIKTYHIDEKVNIRSQLSSMFQLPGPGIEPRTSHSELSTLPLDHRELKEIKKEKENSISPLDSWQGIKVLF